MKKDAVFQNAIPGAGGFEFNEQVAEVFDDMVSRSVPLYREQQRMVVSLGKSFWTAGTTVYDLGCSTATTLIALRRELPQDARLVGYDNSVPMLQRAREKIEASHLESPIETRFGDLNGTPADLDLSSAGVVIMSWTLQFVRPLRRDSLISWIFKNLAAGGALIVTEKILTSHSEMNQCFIDYYYDYKNSQGYSELEISRKREALENVLIPYRAEENIELFRRNGFDIVEQFFQWFNFAGFVCLKTGHPAR